jgi:hypothetical protein
MGVRDNQRAGSFNQRLQQGDRSLAKRHWCVVAEQQTDGPDPLSSASESSTLVLRED